MPPDRPAPLLPSLTNFRDLGGMSLGDRRLKTDLFYRSPRLTDLSDPDLAWLDQRNIHKIVDFRGVAEREAKPLTLGASLMERRLSLPVEPSVAARLGQLDAQGRLNSEAASSAMAQSYRAYVTDNLDVFATFLQICVQADGPVVFHCSAGKDRTGFAAALLLSALGASWPDIMADYLRTRTDWKVPADIRAEAETANRAALLGVETGYLEAAFGELDARYGGATDFAHTCLGDRQILDEFRHRVSDPVE